MDVRLRFAWVVTSAVMVGCSGGDTPSFESTPLESRDQKASYGIGMNVGRQLVDTKDRLDRLAFLRGVDDALREADPAVPSEEIETALQAFAVEVQAAADAEHERVAAENLAAGQAYLAENAAREGVTVTESGLHYEVLTAGDGPQPAPDATVRLHYRGTLIDGTEFDSSYERGEPAVFNVGGLITGFSEALQLMPVGTKARVVIPSEMAYGEQGTGGEIGPNAVLVFEIELLEIVPEA